jgi:hypothetical protein
MSSDPIQWAVRLFQDVQPIVEARLHRKTRNLAAARDRGNERVVRGMQEEVVYLTELSQRIDDWLAENDDEVMDDEGRA